jgi:hypothetical protein
MVPLPHQAPAPLHADSKMMDASGRVGPRVAGCGQPPAPPAGAGEYYFAQGSVSVTSNDSPLRMYVCMHYFAGVDYVL